jgi:LacI family transcriptional regulator
MSIKQLAQELGLSISTVSRALNGYTDVSAATRSRVMRHADMLGYQPHPGARSMKSGKSNTIGIILPLDEHGQFINALYSRLLGGIASFLDERGYTLMVTTNFSHQVRDEVQRYEQLIRSRLVDGVVVVRTLLNDPRVDMLSQMQTPFVTYGRCHEPNRHHWVDTDNERAFELATQRQIEQGHRRIALLNGPAAYTFAWLRQQGYENALRAANILPEPALIQNGDLTESSGYSLTRDLLTMRNKPTALICANDAMAIGAIAACRERGLRVGNDISIMGYGNSDASRYCDPPLSTIEHRAYENGRHIGVLLLAQLEGTQESGGIHHYLESVELVPRLSDGPVSPTCT